MKMSLMTYYFPMFLSGLISLSLNRKHLMTSLLSLEMMILGLFCPFSFMSLYMYMYMYMYMWMYMYMYMYMLLIFLTFSVCEGVMGLSCLVVLIRSHSNDYLLSMSLSTC